ncbi:hypothetical protein F5H01DRAFT_346506 [Linnemannia elongata]|nr:hypothetical protein F5H01DRAFT_346506 [Linnemannia elongata]
MKDVFWFFFYFFFLEACAVQSKGRQSSDERQNGTFSIDPLRPKITKPKQYLSSRLILILTHTLCIHTGNPVRLSQYNPQFLALQMEIPTPATIFPPSSIAPIVPDSTKTPIVSKVPTAGDY